MSGSILQLSSLVDQALAAIPSPLSSSGIFVYGVGGMLLLVVLARLNQGDDTASVSPDTPDAEAVDLSGELEELELTDIGEQQRSTLAPDAVEVETRAARVGDQWTSTLHVASLPDYPKDGTFSRVFEETGAEFDLTTHIDPKDHDKARADLQNQADSLTADADLERTARRQYLQDRARQATATHQAVEEGEQVFDISVFVTVRGDTKEELQEARRQLMGHLRDRPAFMEPKVAVCRQLDALRSAAPLGGDHLERDHVALGGAVGALLSSPHNPTILEEGGVEMGIHRDTDTPIVIDPFERDDGYAMFVVGDPGSGKSFSSKMNFIRSIEQSQDRIGYIIEPMGNWAGVSEALGAERVSVGGDKTLNPLEISKPPAHVRQAMADDENPLKARIDRAVSWFTLYFSLRNAGLGDRRTTLERALRTAYARKGITNDVATHDRESPTMDTVFDVLDHMVKHPDEYINRSTEETTKIADDALWLLDQFSPFTDGGQFEHLNGHSEFDIRDAKTMYLDLGQQGGSMSSNTSLLMELLISLVYERAKETTDEVIFYIDESRYIMKDEQTMEFLETIFRHHRHHDLSIRLVTQTVDEFLASDVSEIILDQCAIKQFHKLDGMDDEIARKFGLNQAQQQFVATATEGSEKKGYSEALVGVDGEWRGIRVEALPKEQSVIDFEPTKQRTSDLPGRGYGSASTSEQDDHRDRPDEGQTESEQSDQTENEQPADSPVADAADEDDEGAADESMSSFTALDNAIDEATDEQAADKAEPTGLDEGWEALKGDDEPPTAGADTESPGTGSEHSNGSSDTDSFEILEESTAEQFDDRSSDTKE